MLPTPTMLLPGAQTFLHEITGVLASPAMTMVVGVASTAEGLDPIPDFVSGAFSVLLELRSGLEVLGLSPGALWVHLGFAVHNLSTSLALAFADTLVLLFRRRTTHDRILL
jgi:hypothetical protein